MKLTPSTQAIVLGFCFVGCGAKDAESPEAREGALGSASLVVSQVYGGGGNANAPYPRDFIELFNPTTTRVGLNGWSVQYAGPVTSTWQVTPISGVVGAHRYFLIWEAQGLNPGGSMPPADGIGAINMGSTSGKVALVRTQVQLSCGTGTPCLPNPDIVDLVGYGSLATSFEGSGPAPTISNTTSDRRVNSGFTDTDNNASDFTAGTVSPLNSSVCGTGGAGACGGEPWHWGDGRNGRPGRSLLIRRRSACRRRRSPSRNGGAPCPRS